MDPALRGGFVGIGGRDDLLIEVELPRVGEGGLFPHGFRTWEDLVVEDDRARGSEDEVVDEAGGLLAVRSGVGEGDLGEVLGGIEPRFDPLEVGVDRGEGLVRTEVLFEFPVGEEAGGAGLAIGMGGVLNFRGDDAVHGVAVIAGVDGGGDVEGFSEFDGFGDDGPGDRFARGRGDEEWLALCPGIDPDWNLDGGGELWSRLKGFVSLSGDGAGNGGFAQCEGGFRGEKIPRVCDVEPARIGGGVVHKHEGVAGPSETDVKEAQVFGDGGQSGLDANRRSMERIEEICFAFAKGMNPKAEAAAGKRMVEVEFFRVAVGAE